LRHAGTSRGKLLTQILSRAWQRRCAEREQALSHVGGVNDRENLGVELF
jgi:hypothetical protein